MNAAFKKFRYYYYKYLADKFKLKYLYFYLYILVFIIGSSSCIKWEKMYEYGDIVEKITFKNNNNKELSLTSEVYNVIFFIKYYDSDPALIKYISRIFREKYRELGLNIICIMHTIPQNIKKDDVSFPVFPLKKNIELLNKFIDVDRINQALIFINPETKLDTIFYFFSEDDVRQLFEKYMLGEITYSNDIELKKIQVGDTFPAITIRSLETNLENSEIETSGFAPQLWFLFSSKCVSCALNNYLKQFKLLEKKLSEKLKISRSLIFSHFFQEEQVREHIQFYKIETPAYVAIGDIPGFENGYFKHVSMGSILVVLTDRNNGILYVEKFPDFVMNFEGGHINELFFNL